MVLNVRERLGWALAAILSLVVVVSVSGIAEGGSLDPPGPPAPTGPIEVVEQNVDANGNVRVAQQGPVDVNVLSQGAPGTVIPVALDLVIPVNFTVGEFTFSPFVDVSHCSDLSVFYEFTLDQNLTGAATIIAEAVSSVNGQQGYSPIGGPVNVNYGLGVPLVVRASAGVAFDSFQSPYAGVRFTNNDLDMIGRILTVDVSFYCVP